MDLLGMINDGAEVLHRGSVDRSGDSSPASGSTSSPPRQHQSPRNGGPPVWAQIYRGRRNKVRDPRRWKLSETRPELAQSLDSYSDAEDLDAAHQRHVADEDPEEADDVVDPTPVSIPQPLNLKKTPFSGNAIPPPRASEVGPGGNVSLTGLTASLASLIPGDDQTKVLAGWIYEKLQPVSLENLGNVEIEFKLGLIADENTMRHRFPNLSEAVVDFVYWRQERLRFKSEVDIGAFKSLETLLDSLALAHAASDNNPITRSNILTRDESYNVNVKMLGEGNKKVRVSYNDRGSVVECISKQRLGDLYISQPNSAYDLKMTLSIEHPVKYEEIQPEIKGVQPMYERNKNRLEWKSPGCQVDLTSVHGIGSGGNPTVTKEVEVESNVELLGEVLREIREARDKAIPLDKFLEVVRYTMDSARYLVRNI